ncbi:MAG TPA: DHH family phosphoesterase [Labilithrix sp.]|nr:DHH family phosphoesterase [Labilithrix sp.]
MTVDRDTAKPEQSRARELIVEASTAGGPVALAYHADADGISSAALVWAAVEHLGGEAVALTPPKGKNVYDRAFRALLERASSRLLTLLDTGSRAGVSWRQQPTIIVDHHVTSSRPDVAAFVHDHDAVSTSILVYELLEPIAPSRERSWLAAVGALGDRGAQARRVPVVSTMVARFGSATLGSVVALVNASGRAATPAPEVALAALREARHPREISRGASAAADHLRQMRAEVAASSKRALRVAPRVRGRWAIIEIEEGCRVHGVVASAWARRLAPRIVFVANRGYVEGRVHISVRSHEDIDLRAALRGLLPDESGDYAAGHARATGAIIDFATYERLLRAIDEESSPRAVTTGPAYPPTR